MKRLVVAALLAASVTAAAAAGRDDMAAAGAAQQKKQYSEAVRLYGEALASGDLAPAERLVVYYNRGLAHIELRQFDKAIADNTAAIRLKPDFADAYQNRGTAYALAGQYDKGIADYTAAIRLAPTAMAYDGRGNAWSQKHRYDKAIADYDAAIRLDPDLAEAYDSRGHAWSHMHLYDKAIADYDAAIARAGDDADFLADRGYARFDLARFAEAAADLRKSLSLEPSHAYVVLWLHLARARLGEDDTQDLADDAALIDPEAWPAPVVTLFLGRATPQQVEEAAARGDAEKARQQRCEADFYLGEAALLRHDVAAARVRLHAARDTCPDDFIEYEGASSELRRLGK